MQPIDLRNHADEPMRQKTLWLLWSILLAWPHNQAFATSPTQLASLYEAKDVLDRPAKKNATDQKAKKEVLAPGELGLEMESQQSNDDAEKLTYAAGWTGKQLRVYTHHYQKKTSLDESPYSASEIGLGYSLEKKSFHLDTSLGYYNEADNPVTYKAQMEAVLSSTHEISTYVRLQRKPLIGQVISYEQGLSILRDQALVSVTWQPIEVIAQYNQDGSEDPWEYYLALFHLPLTRGPHPMESSALALGLSLENRAKASPNYDSFPKRTSALISYRDLRQWGQKNVTKISALYEAVRVELWDTGETVNDQEALLECLYERRQTTRARFFVGGSYWLRLSEELPTQRKSKYAVNFGAGMTL